MTDLERLIAALKRPTPSEQVDDYVQSLLGQKQVLVSRPRWRGVLALLGTAACVGIIGFFCGRQSVIYTANSTNTTVTIGGEGLPPDIEPASTKVVRIPLADDQLANFFIRRTETESLLGNAPLKTQVSMSP